MSPDVNILPGHNVHDTTALMVQMPVDHEGTKLRKSKNGPPRIWPKAKVAAEKLAARKAPPLEVFSAFRLTQVC